MDGAELGIERVTTNPEHHTPEHPYVGVLGNRQPATHQINTPFGSVYAAPTHHDPNAPGPGSARDVDPNWRHPMWPPVNPVNPTVGLLNPPATTLPRVTAPAPAAQQGPYLVPSEFSFSGTAAQPWSEAYWQAAGLPMGLLRYQYPNIDGTYSSPFGQMANPMAGYGGPGGIGYIPPSGGPIGSPGPAPGPGPGPGPDQPHAPEGRDANPADRPPTWPTIMRHTIPRNLDTREGGEIVVSPAAKQNMISATQDAINKGSSIEEAAATAAAVGKATQDKYRAYSGGYDKGPMMGDTWGFIEDMADAEMEGAGMSDAEISAAGGMEFGGMTEAPGRSSGRSRSGGSGR